MMRTRHARPSWGSILGLLLAVALCAQGARSELEAEVEALVPGDFAVGRTLEIERAGALQSVLLDFDVYRRSVEPGLADLRVFDAQGRPVPYAIRRRLPGAKQEQVLRSLPLFTLDRAMTEQALPTARFAADAFRIEAQLSETGAIVSVAPAGGEPATGDLPVAWLLDASDLRRAVVGLVFELDAEGGPFVSSLRIEASDDLASFRRVGQNLALARLEQAGHRIERLKFALPATRAKYLRITAQGSPPAARIRSVTARLAPSRPAPKRVEASLQGRFDPDQSGLVHFDLGGWPPVDRLRVRLEDENALVEAQLESAPEREGPWRRRFSGLLYSIDQGGRLENPAIDWSARGDRYLRLTVSARGGGRLESPPTLIASWRPEQLLFLHRGDGPSQLAIGRVETPDGSFADTELLRIARRNGASVPENTARLGPETILAGESALVVEDPIPWRTYGLWALLLASVAVVLALSLKLLRGVDD